MQIRYILVISLFLLVARSMFGQTPIDTKSGTIKNSVHLSLYRLHNDASCISGQLLVEGKVIAYALERPWEGNIPLISSIPSGHYSGYIRTETKDRWRIELRDVRDRGNIQIHIGNTIADSLGCVLVGKNLSANMCQLIDSVAAMNSLKLALASAAAGLGQVDFETPVDLTILDYTEGSQILESDQNLKRHFVESIARSGSPSKSDVERLWLARIGGPDHKHQLTASTLANYATTHRDDVVISDAEKSDIPTQSVNSSVELGLRVASVLNGHSDTLDHSLADSMIMEAHQSLLNSSLVDSLQDPKLKQALAQINITDAVKIPIVSSANEILQRVPEDERNFALQVLALTKGDVSVNKEELTSKASSLALSRLRTEYETQIKSLTGLSSSNIETIYKGITEGKLSTANSIEVGTAVIGRIAVTIT